MTHFWLSFADPEREPGTQFLGGCVVEASDFADAIDVAWAAGCNPGGQVKGQPIPDAMVAHLRESDVNTLYLTHDAVDRWYEDLRGRATQ